MVRTPGLLPGGYVYWMDGEDRNVLADLIDWIVDKLFDGSRSPYEPKVGDTVRVRVANWKKGGREDWYRVPVIAVNDREVTVDMAGQPDDVAFVPRFRGADFGVLVMVAAWDEECDRLRILQPSSTRQPRIPLGWVRFVKRSAAA